MGVLELEAYRPDVLQLTDLDPADGTTGVSPGGPITFDLHTSCPPWVEDFEDGDNGWLRCTYGNGYTQGQWNSGGSDEWSLIDDGSGSNQIYKASARATSLAIDHWDETEAADLWADSRVHAQWKTGGGGGLCHRFRWYDNYGKTTQGVRGPAVEITPSGVQYVFYHWDNSRDVRGTSSFTPTDGAWYWLRMQVYNRDGSYYRFRGKYWTGTPEDEPATWNFNWYNDFQTVNSWANWKGCGLHNYQGEIRYDSYAILTKKSPDYLDNLVVTVNGIDHTVADGTVLVEHEFDHWTPQDRALLLPYIHLWKVKVFCPLATQYWDNPITVVVKFRGVTISSTDFDVSSFPVDPPEVDPDTYPYYVIFPGDPSRMGSFGQRIDGTTGPDGRKFIWLVQLFAERWGWQELTFAVAYEFWRYWGWDFIWNKADPLYTPVDGRYLIGHPVWQEVPGSMVPAESVWQDVPSDVVPRGDRQRSFPADVVPQGWLRREFPASMLPSFQLWYEGSASGLVGWEVVRELDASGLVFKRREGSTIHLEVISSTVYDQLEAMGIILGTVISLQMGQLELQPYSMQVGAGWYDPAWAYRVPVTVLAAKVGADHSGFDVLLTEDNFASSFFSNCRTDGADILVTGPDGKSKLPRDLIHWNKAGEELRLRFNADILGSTNTPFYVYYGNPSGSETNDTATYDSSILAYWTMDETPSGAGSLIDRTGTYDADPYSVSQQASGALGPSVECSGSTSSYVDGQDVDVAGNEITVQCWAYLDVRAGTTYRCLLRKPHAAVHAYPYGSYYLSMDSPNEYMVFTVGDGTNNENTGSSSDMFPLTTWTMVTGTWDGPNDELYLYFNQTEEASNLATTLTGLGSSAVPLLIFKGYHATSQYWDGRIDELRILDRYMEPEEIQTRHNNESDPASFYSVGSPETPP